MKKLFTALVILFPLWLFAQIPVGLNYQAIAWDNNNVPMSNKNVEVIFEILYGTPGSGNVVTEFDEVQNVTTNEAGLFTLIIGGKDTEKFKKIDWTKTPKYLRVTIDKVVSPITPMLSVPYAQYAERTNLQAGAGISVNGNTITNAGDNDNDTQNEIQRLGLDGNKLSLSKGGGEIPMTATNYSFSRTSIVSTLTGTTRVVNHQDIYTVPDDGKYLLMLKVAATDSDLNANYSPKMIIIASVSGEIYDENFSTLEETQNDFKVINLKKNEKISIRVSMATITSDVVLLNIQRLLLMKME